MIVQPSAVAEHNDADVDNDEIESSTKRNDLPASRSVLPLPLMSSAPINNLMEIGTKIEL